MFGRINMSGNGEVNGQPTAFKFGGFKFAKSAKPKSAIVKTESRFQAESAFEKNDNNVDFITAIDDKQIKGTRAESSAASELVIPFIAVNKYNIAKTKTETTATASTAETSTADESDAADDLISKAKQELIQEAKKFENDQDPSEIPAWKLMVINKAPDEYENDNKLDVSIRPAEPTLDDYESVPVEAFGSALLRGMGWKAGDPIGGINKAITPIFEPQIRARGLGLGADASLQKQLQNTGKNSKNARNDEPPIKVGCFVCVEVGQSKGRYGTIQSINNDLSSVQIKLNLTKEVIDFPPVFLRIVSKAEFDQEGRILNKSSYDDYKLKDGSSTKVHSDAKPNSHDSSLKMKERHKDSEIWLMTDILAEIRDKEYKDGKYYKEEVVILETNGDRCRCRTKKDRILDDISQTMLRTVIPRKNDTVMIVRGQHRGKLATLQHIGRHEATVKLLDTIGKPFDISLNSISKLHKRH